MEVIQDGDGAKEYAGDDAILIAGDDSYQVGGEYSILIAGKNSVQYGRVGSSFKADVGTLQAATYISERDGNKDVRLSSITVTENMANRWVHFRKNIGEEPYWEIIPKETADALDEWVAIRMINPKLPEVYL